MSNLKFNSDLSEGRRWDFHIFSITGDAELCCVYNLLLWFPSDECISLLVTGHRCWQQRGEEGGGRLSLHQWACWLDEEEEEDHRTGNDTVHWSDQEKNKPQLSPPLPFKSRTSALVLSLPHTLTDLSAASACGSPPWSGPLLSSSLLSLTPNQVRLLLL